MTNLTPKEEMFLDHHDYEGMVSGDPNAEYPAHNWMFAHGVAEHEIWNLLVVRGRQRGYLMLEKPQAPFEPAWDTGDEARRRNQELRVLVEGDNVQ